MPFTPKAWKNDKAGGTKLNATGLNDLEKRIAAGMEAAGLLVKAEDFGAVGSGEAEDTEALQYALAEAASRPGMTWITGKTGAIYLHDELEIESNVGLWAMSFKLVPGAASPYGIRNADYMNGNSNITLRDCVMDGNKALISGDRAIDENPSALLRFVAADGQLCRNIRIEGIHQHDAKRLGCAFANVEGLFFTGLVEDNGRDAVTLQSNCSMVRFDYVARGCGDDGLGINSEQNPELVHDLHDVKGRVAIYGPGDDGPGLGVTVRGGRDIDIDLTAEGLEGWGLGVFDAYATKAKDITVRGTVRSCGSAEGTETFYSSAAVILAGAVIHKSGGPHAGVEGVDLTGLRVQGPVGIGTEVKSVRGAYGSMQHIWLPGQHSGGTKSIVLGDYLYHIVADRPKFRSVVDGLISKGTHVLHLQILEPELYNILAGTGILVENATTGVIRGWVIDGDGKNGQTGIKLKALAGTWHLDGDFINECTTATDFSAIGSPTLVGGSFSLAPLAKLTTADAGTVDNTYGEPEAKVISNLRTRLGEVEARLKSLGQIA